MWIAETGNQEVAHTLNGTLFGRAPRQWVSLCGVELQPEGDGPDVPRCSRCQELREALSPRYYKVGRPGSGHKLPRCTCPECGGVHIKGRST